MEIFLNPAGLGYLALLAVFGLAGLWLVWRSLGALFRRRLLRAGVGTAVGGLLLVIAVVMAGIALNLRTYQRLTAERPVATLAFRQLGPQRFQCHLTTADGGDRTLVLAGDQWQLDARVIKWKGTATVLGLDTLYRLERLAGRYRDVARERFAEHTAIDLSARQGLDVWAVARRRDWLPWVDASYGSATYLPMADGAVFSVSLSNTGLLARPVNQAAAQALLDW
ncbi:MAG: cation/multidrug efflux pump [Gammaproteobacteria bacterium]|jgi:hypothetical protein